MDTFTVTILFILISALFVVIIRKLKKDKCLKDFQDNIVVFEKLGGQEVKGMLNVFNTGMEFVYSIAENNPPEINSSAGLPRLNLGTYLLYKGEYSSIQILVRYLDEQSEKARLERERNMKRTFEPSKIQRFFRKLNNFLKTIKDSLLEIVNLVGNHLGKGTAVGMFMTSQDKYINKVKNELYTSVDNSFEPLLENYIGYRVIIELKREEDLVQYSGILIRYTSEFIELFDVDYNGKADLIIPRRYGVVRGLLI